jgi:nicotinamide-nucleotide amidase
MPTAEILSQGDEVLTGQVVDTNAAWLSERLTALGVDVVRHTAVGDRLGDIVPAVRTACERADLVLSTGGLGPTDDDLTAQAVASVFDVELVLDPIALAHIQALYVRHDRRMPAVNRKQALLPAGSVRLDNDMGTAPGFALTTDRGLAAFLPGVPREMRHLFDARVLPLLGERFDLVAGRLVTLRTTGAGESDLQERIGHFQSPDAILSFRTRLPENHVKLRFAPGVPDDRITAVARDLARRIGSPVFCIEGLDDIAGDLHAVVVHTLLRHDATVATAESCTGGRVAALLTAVPGSSGAFLEGVVTYSNAAKTRQLGVDPGLLAEHGAVSEPVARAMAEGVRDRAGATFGLSTTGIAGPGGGSEAKPVGTVHIALATPETTHHRRLRLGGDRERIQRLSAAAVLDLLRRHLQGVLPTHP